MENKIMKVIYRELRRKDLELTDKLIEAFDGNYDYQIIQEISAKTNFVNDVVTDYRNEKFEHTLDSYMEYLDKMNSELCDGLFRANTPSDIRAIFAKLETVTQLIFEAKCIIKEVRSEYPEESVSDIEEVKLDMESAAEPVKPSGVQKQITIKSDEYLDRPAYFGTLIHDIMRKHLDSNIKISYPA